MTLQGQAQALITQSECMTSGTRDLRVFEKSMKQSPGALGTGNSPDGILRAGGGRSKGGRGTREGQNSENLLGGPSRKELMAGHTFGLI